MGRVGFEPTTLAGQGSRPCAYANSATYPQLNYKAFKAWRIVQMGNGQDFIFICYQ